MAIRSRPVLYDSAWCARRPALKAGNPVPAEHTLPISAACAPHPNVEAERSVEPSGCRRSADLLRLPGSCRPKRGTVNSILGERSSAPLRGRHVGRALSIGADG